MPPVRREPYSTPSSIWGCRRSARATSRRNASTRRRSFYPLHVRLCASCLLVQLPAYVPGEDIFSDYAYFSSYSDSWVAHAKRYAEAMIGQLGLTSDSLVTEVASNDGYLLQHFVGRGHPGARGRAGRERRRGRRAAGRADGGGVPGARDRATRSPRQYGPADLVAGNNVFAHVPDIRGFAAGLRALVKDTGLVTLEFPHLLRLIERRQYDTIYHEHYSYLSLLTSSRALATAGLAGRRRGRARTPTAVRCASTPGPKSSAGEPSTRVKAVLDDEEAAGLHTLEGHAGFAAEVLQIKSDLLDFLLDAAKRRPVAWPATAPPGKGNTLLNHCGIRIGPSRLHGRSQPGQAGKVSPGHAHPDLSRPSAWPRPSLTTSWSCRGTSGTRSAGSSSTSARGAGDWSFRSPSSKSSE